MMKRIFFVACMAIMLVLACAAGAEKAYPSVTGPLKVTGTALTDMAGEPVQLKGLSTHGLAWFPQYVNTDLFHQLHDEFGVNAVRLAMYTAENGGYCAGGNREKLKQLVLDGVRYAKEADLYVIVDWHILFDNDPNIHADEAVAFFDEISAALAGETHVLYEICNEPNSGTDWASISAYANRVIPVIRAHAPEAVILVGTPNWCQSITDPLSAPLAYDNVMYDLHYYAATHGSWLRENLRAAIGAGLPVFVSEYGVCSADGNGTYDFAAADVWADLLDEYSVSSMMWSIANKAELSAIIKPTCGKVSGFTRDDLTDGGLWLVDRLGGTLSGNAVLGAAARQDTSAAIGENMLTPGGLGSWVDTGSGASAQVNWNGHNCTAVVKTSGKSKWFVQPSCAGLTLEKGGVYELSFTIRSTESITFDAGLQQNYGSYRGYMMMGDLSASAQEQTYTKQMTMSGATDDSVALVFNIGGNGTLAYEVTITDVVLTRIR